MGAGFVFKGGSGGAVTLTLSRNKSFPIAGIFKGGGVILPPSIRSDFSWSRLGNGRKVLTS